MQSNIHFLTFLDNHHVGRVGNSALPDAFRCMTRRERATHTIHHPLSSILLFSQWRIWRSKKFRSFLATTPIRRSGMLKNMIPWFCLR